MSRKSLEPHRHLDKVVRLGFIIVRRSELGILRERLSERDAELLRNHLRDPVHIRVAHVERASDIAQYGPRLQSTEGHDLHHVVLSVLAHNIVNDLLPSLGAEVNIDIGHRNTLGVQETLEHQIVRHRVDLRDIEHV